MTAKELADKLGSDPPAYVYGEAQRDPSQLATLSSVGVGGLVHISALDDIPEEKLKEFRKSLFWLLPAGKHKFVAYYSDAYAIGGVSGGGTSDEVAFDAAMLPGHTYVIDRTFNVRGALVGFFLRDLGFDYPRKCLFFALQRTPEGVAQASTCVEDAHMRR